MISFISGALNLIEIFTEVNPDSAIKTPRILPLFDSTIWHTYVKVNKTIINHGYIDTLIGRMYWRAINEFLEIISNMMDYHKLEGRIEYKLKENN